jgi:hypothetical protein
VLDNEIKTKGRWAVQVHDGTKVVVLALSTTSLTVVAGAGTFKPTTILCGEPNDNAGIDANGVSEGAAAAAAAAVGTTGTAGAAGRVQFGFEELYGQKAWVHVLAQMFSLDVLLVPTIAG